MSPKFVSKIDASALMAIAPAPPSKKAAAQRAILTSFGDLLPTLLAGIECNTSLRVAHFLAQLAHESDGFCTLEEYASGAAYEGRADLGNVRAGDGVRYKGRGPIQLTGRANYRSFTVWMRRNDPGCPDFEAQPDLVATWPWAGWAAAFFWSRNNVNRVADKDDLVAVTKIVNGGRNGLEDRRRYLAKAKTAVAALEADALSSVQVFPVLRRGMHGEPVELLQRKLQAALHEAGYPAIAIDGDFGPGTEMAVRIWQHDMGLTVDGIVGKATMTSLNDFFPD